MNTVEFRTSPSALAERLSLRKIKLPAFIVLIFAVNYISALGGGSLFGFSLKGYAWTILVVFAVLILLKTRQRITFPIYIWIPWLLLLTISMIMSEYPNALQRTIMMIMPILVGVTVSTLRPSEVLLEKFMEVCRWSVWVLWGLSLVRTGTALTGVVPESTALAAEAMTGVLLAGVFAADAAFGSKKSLIYWWIAAALPVFAMTRTAIVAAALTFPMTLAPLRMKKRVLSVAVIALIGLGLFFTERVQSKMFYSGRGELEDVRWDNPDFRTSGRSVTWRHMENAIQREPWFGYGANAQEMFLFKVYGKTAQPHNDWLRLRFDYGWIGTGLFAVTLLTQFLHAWWFSRRRSKMAKMMLMAGASGFLGFVMLMYTDNILLYGAFYANLQFTLLALGYARIATERQESTVSQPLYSVPIGLRAAR